MNERDISSSNALVYHIKNLANDWLFTNPYFNALRALLLQNENINFQELRVQQEYHFIAKMQVFIDEIHFMFIIGNIFPTY